MNTLENIFSENPELNEPVLETLSTRKPAEETVLLSTLKPCDTVFVQTSFSKYRVQLLDPQSGRAVVQGGRYMKDPVEATVKGSTLGGPVIKLGAIEIGLRMEMFIDGHSLITSPVKSWRIEKTAEPPCSDDKIENRHDA